MSLFDEDPKALREAVEAKTGDPGEQMKLGPAALGNALAAILPDLSDEALRKLLPWLDVKTGLALCEFTSLPVASIGAGGVIDLFIRPAGVSFRDLGERMNEVLRSRGEKPAISRELLLETAMGSVSNEAESCHLVVPWDSGNKSREDAAAEQCREGSIVLAGFPLIAIAHGFHRLNGGSLLERGIIRADRRALEDSQEGAKFHATWNNDLAHPSVYTAFRVIKSEGH